MYFLKTEHSFDAAHFLSGYQGKCANLHGHRWRVVVEIQSETLEQERQKRGMIVDFGDFKRDLAEAADFFDHAMIYEENTLRPATVAALEDEGFRLIPVPFRPTAEHFAEYFYRRMTGMGYQVARAIVYETPNNCASYAE